MYRAAFAASLCLLNLMHRFRMLGAIAWGQTWTNARWGRVREVPVRNSVLLLVVLSLTQIVGAAAQQPRHSLAPSVPRAPNTPPVLPHLPPYAPSRRPVLRLPPPPHFGWGLPRVQPEASASGVGGAGKGALVGLGVGLAAGLVAALVFGPRVRGGPRGLHCGARRRRRRLGCRYWRHRGGFNSEGLTRTRLLRPGCDVSRQTLASWARESNPRARIFSRFACHPRECLSRSLTHRERPWVAPFPRRADPPFGKWQPLALLDSPGAAFKISRTIATLDKGTPGQSRGRNATGPRSPPQCRTPDATKDPTTAEPPSPEEAPGVSLKQSPIQSSNLHDISCSGTAARSPGLLSPGR